MSVPELCGGLGNQLFQVCSVYGLSLKTGNDFAIDPRYINSNCYKHSKEKYIESIFNKFTICNVNITGVVHENMIHDYLTRTLTSAPLRTKPMPPATKACGTLFKGYYQDPSFFDHQKTKVLSMLNWESAKNSIVKYDVENSIFIHFRLGDFLHPDTAWLHNIVTPKYYEEALSHFDTNTSGIGGTASCGTGLLVFSNEPDNVVSRFPFLTKYNYTIVRENEMDSMYIMSRCRLGGICANSTFSWWGAYLNDSPVKKIVMPSRFYKSDSIPQSAYYFKDVIKIEV